MSYEQFQKQSRRCAFHSVVEEQQGHLSPRNGNTKRRRDDCNPTNNGLSFPPLPMTKRLRRLIPDDEISPVEEEEEIAPQTLPAVLPEQHPSGFASAFASAPPMLPARLPPPIQRTVSDATDVAAVSPPPPTTSTTAPCATDYQPMNSLLGNLHLMRQQQQQQRRRQAELQALRNKGPAANTQTVSPLHTPQQHQQQQRHQQQQQQQQQHAQNQYHRHYGNYHSVPTTTSRAKNDSQKRGVSLRVTSNLY